MSFEAAGKVALVRPAHGTPDAGDGLVGMQEQDGGVLGAELGEASHRGAPSGGIEQPDQIARGNVQPTGQVSQGPRVGQVRFQRLHRLDDRRMRRPGQFGQPTPRLNHCLAELAEQERQAANDVGPVQRQWPMPERGQRVQMREAVTEGSLGKIDGKDSAAGR
jgi:hypothetical protein